jgi:hypothetical protein
MPDSAPVSRGPTAAENNLSVASALADWAWVEREFHAGENQNRGMIQFKNPENNANNSAWIDDLKIERVGDYRPQKPAGIKPLTARKQVDHLGLKSHPDEKLEWLLDAKFGMMITWGMYAGLERGEWVMHQSKIRPEDYRAYAYASAGDQYFAADKYDPAQWAKLAKAAGMKYMNLMTKYGKIDILFWDGGYLAQQGTSAAAAFFWESGKYMDPQNEWPVNPYFQDIDETTGKPLGLMGIVRKHQPDIIVNSRSGWYGDIREEEGGAQVTGAIRTEDIYEKCMSMGPGWGYTRHYRNPEKIRTVEEVKRMLADCVVRNMVYILNVGPDRHGEITPLVQERLLEVGKWLEKVGDAVYSTRGGPWNPKDGHYGFTYKDNKIFVYLFSDFTGDTFTLPALNEGQDVIKAYVVGDNTPVAMAYNKDREVTLSGISRPDKVVTILAVELNKDVMD